MGKVLMVMLVIVGGIVCGGCNIIGFLASPAPYDRKVPAEFDLSSRMEEGVVVIVDQPRGSRARVGFDLKLEETIKEYLGRKAGIKREYLVKYDKSLLSAGGGLNGLSPLEIGSASGAGLLLYVRIEDYGLYEMGAKDYYKGSLVTRSVLLETGSGAVLWPESGDGRVVRTMVELETNGAEMVLTRLRSATSHCISRSLYDCRNVYYRTSDEHNIYDLINE
jgi:hypothetical protein